VAYWVHASLPTGDKNPAHNVICNSRKFTDFTEFDVTGSFVKMKTADFVGKCHGCEVITEVWYTHRIDVLTRHGLRTNLGTTVQASYRPRLVSDCLLNGKPDKSTQYIR